MVGLCAANHKSICLCQLWAVILAVATNNNTGQNVALRKEQLSSVHEPRECCEGRLADKVALSSFYAQAMGSSSKQSSRQAPEAESVVVESKPEHQPLVPRAQPRDIFAFLLVLRLINALCVRTFFQPDEYFQALEPAWSIAFGSDSGAWLTWVWPALPLFLYQACTHKAIRNGSTNCDHHCTRRYSALRIVVYIS